MDKHEEAVEAYKKVLDYCTYRAEECPETFGKNFCERSNEMKYRKKPVVVEAFQFDGDLKNSNGEWYVPAWAIKAFEDGIIFYGIEDPWELYIKTLEGVHHVSVDDYIIQGINGELYPCKPDIFDKTYEKVVEQEKTYFEYLKNCTMDEMVQAIYDCTMANSWSFNKDGIKRWLKQPHTKE